ncbi:hypothetical protein PINS_up006803 [Pythium insidiosum]|nr:hypothetical protein PINS_up006803 [Pythium insidiosum]
MSATVFVRNLPFDVTQDALEQVFGEIGPVKKVDVIKDKGKQKSETTTRGFAFVRFAMAADAEAAIQQLHQSDFRGRKMLVEIAKEKGKNHEKKKAAVAPVEKAPVETEKETETEEKTPKQKPKSEEKEAAPAPAPASVEAAEKEDEDAKKSKKDKKKKDKKKSKEAEPTEEAPPAEEAPQETAKEAADGHVQSERNARRRMHREFLRQVAARKEASATAEQKTVLVFGLGRDVTQKALYKKVKKLAAVTKVELKEDAKTNRQSAVVQLEKLADVALVVQKLDQHIFKGATLRAVPAVKTADASGAVSVSATAKSGDSHRLIVRNLSFQATDADLDKLFSAVGPISEARVVRLPVEDGAAEARSVRAAALASCSSTLWTTRGARSSSSTATSSKAERWSWILPCPRPSTCSSSASRRAQPLMRTRTSAWRLTETARRTRTKMMRRERTTTMTTTMMMMWSTTMSWKCRTTTRLKAMMKMRRKTTKTKSLHSRERILMSSVCARCSSATCRSRRLRSR